MIKGQIHEDFSSFRGSSLTAMTPEINAFLKSGNFAAKSIAVLASPNGGYIVSIGYRNDEPTYPVSIVNHPISTVDLDAAIKNAAKVSGDVICHSFFTVNNEVSIVFLVHG